MIPYGGFLSHRATPSKSSMYRWIFHEINSPATPGMGYPYDLGNLRPDVDPKTIVDQILRAVPPVPSADDLHPRPWGKTTESKFTPID